MKRQFPIVHIDRIVERSPNPRDRGTYALADLQRLVSLLAETGATTPSTPFLNAGFVAGESLDVPFLFALSDPGLRSIANWWEALTPTGFASLLFCASSTLDDPETISPRDFPLLTGAGVSVVSRGVSGDPLVGLNVDRLRSELAESRERLSAALGFEVRALAPAPTPEGRAIDGLVVREARRAGYRLFFEPGGVTEIEGPTEPRTLAYRTVRPADTPESLRDWILGQSLARTSMRLRDLLSKPKEFLERWAPSTPRD